jgi:hypothetical protein
MKVLQGRVAPVVLGAAVIVGSINLAAYAANGHPLLLGGSNSETKPSAVTNTGSGSALTLKTSTKAPPLTVNSTKVVKNLNADTVDGVSASSLGVNAVRYVLTDGDSNFTLNGVAAGSYLVTVDYIVTGATSVSDVVVNVNGSRAGFFYGPSDGTNAFVTGATVITVPKGGAVTLQSNGFALTNSAVTSTATLTPISKLTSGNATGS